jgi:hypothetical protein
MGGPLAQPLARRTPRGCPPPRIQEAPVFPPLAPSPLGHTDVVCRHVRVKVEDEAARDGVAVIKMRIVEDAEEGH